MRELGVAEMRRVGGGLSLNDEQVIEEIITTGKEPDGIEATEANLWMTGILEPALPPDFLSQIDVSSGTGGEADELTAEEAEELVEAALSEIANDPEKLEEAKTVVEALVDYFEDLGISNEITKGLGELADFFTAMQAGQTAYELFSDPGSLDKIGAALGFVVGVAAELRAAAILGAASTYGLPVVVGAALGILAEQIVTDGVPAMMQGYEDWLSSPETQGFAESLNDPFWWMDLFVVPTDFGFDPYAP